MVTVDFHDFNYTNTDSLGELTRLAAEQQGDPETASTNNAGDSSGDDPGDILKLLSSPSVP